MNTSNTSNTQQFAVKTTSGEPTPVLQDQRWKRKTAHT